MVTTTNSSATRALLAEVQATADELTAAIAGLRAGDLANPCVRHTITSLTRALEEELDALDDDQ